MISIEEVFTEETSHQYDEDDSVHYAILIDKQNQKIYIAPFTNIFLLIDLLFSHKIEKSIILYRTQKSRPDFEELEKISATIFGEKGD